MTRSTFCVFCAKSRPRRGVDQTVDVNVFARLTDAKELAQIGRRVRQQGTESILVRPADSTG